MPKLQCAVADVWQREGFKSVGDEMAVAQAQAAEAIKFPLNVALKALFALPGVGEHLYYVVTGWAFCPETDSVSVAPQFAV